MDAISNMGFDYVASGHYANVVHPVTDDSDQPSILKLSRDAVKDQTYFLSHLDQSQLKRLMFPLGHIPKIKFSDFVARQIGEMEGVILEAETGDFLGKHRGFWFYTIGQRQGLRLPGGPWYMVEKDTKNNVVFVSRSYYSIDKRRRVFRVGSLKWLNGKPLEKLSDLQCKVRHGPNLYSCSLMIESCENSRGDIAVVYLSEDDQGLAAGQYSLLPSTKETLALAQALYSSHGMTKPAKRGKGRPRAAHNLPPITEPKAAPTEAHHHMTAQPTRIGRNGGVIHSGRGGRGGNNGRGDRAGREGNGGRVGTPNRGGISGRGGDSGRGGRGGDTGRGGRSRRVPQGFDILFDDKGIAFTNIPRDMTSLQQQTTTSYPSTQASVNQNV
ncbi:hypothetical protein KSS87_002011 [Heliosperma pusillum]|nr:hypothetical protein KSS87_002011 [Heliosperma pusillum]